MTLAFFVIAAISTALIAFTFWRRNKITDLTLEALVYAITFFIFVGVSISSLITIDFIYNDETFIKTWFKNPQHLALSFTSVFILNLGTALLQVIIEERRE